MIRGFHGPHAWLSNFYSSPVVLDGMRWPTVEHAYQAAKHPSQIYRTRILAATAGEAKALGRLCRPRTDWPEIRLDVMRGLLAEKFRDGTELAERLLATRYEQIVEDNTWGDTFWGVCNGEGANWLGRLIQAQRAQIRHDRLIEEIKAAFCRGG